MIFYFMIKKGRHGVLQVFVFIFIKILSENCVVTQKHYKRGGHDVHMVNILLINKYLLYKISRCWFRMESGF